VGRLALLLGLVLVAAACGGGTTETVTVTGAPQGTDTVVKTVTLEPGPTGTIPAALRSPTFQMPSKNIGCATSEGVLVCDILSGLKPEPKSNCELDWTGMEMERLGPAQPRCAGDTAYDQNAPVLAYGNGWASGGFMCESSQDGLLCHNEEGHGFSLSRNVWKQF
jgi:hypothetical protein